MLKKALAVTFVTAAASLALSGTASAHSVYDPQFTTGSGSVLGGNQVDADVKVPVTVCGVSVAVLGLSGAHC